MKKVHVTHPDAEIYTSRVQVVYDNGCSMRGVWDEGGWACANTELTTPQEQAGVEVKQFKTEADAKRWVLTELGLDYSEVENG